MTMLLAATTWTVLFFNGLGIYGPGPTTPLGLALATDVSALGARVVIDNHLSTPNEEPIAILGHSAGGCAALRMGKRARDLVLYEPIIITYDAVPRWSDCEWRCPVKVCINFHTPFYPRMPGAQNIPVQLEHVTMVFSPSLQSRTLDILRPHLRPMVSGQGYRAAKARSSTPNRPPSPSAKGDGASVKWGRR